MSFRKSYSSEKRGGVNLKSSASISQKSSGIFERLFTRNSPSILQKPETKFYNNNNNNECSGSGSKVKLLWDLELDLIYTSNVLRQRLDQLNRNNLILQLNECVRLIQKSLLQSQALIESLSLNSDLLLSLRESLKQVIHFNQLFAEWTQSLSGNESTDQSIGHNIFSQLHQAAKSFTEKIKVTIEDRETVKKRRSIDNGLMQTFNVKSDSSYKGCFSEEDREFIEKLKKLDEDIDRPPPKPQLTHVNQEFLDEYLNKIEAIVRAEKEAIYEYSEITNNEELIKRNLKVENNCIMTTSTTSQDIPTVDGVALEPVNEVTPTPIVLPRNGLQFLSTPNNVHVADSRRSMPERDKNMPLPPVPVASKVSTKFKNPQIPTSFHSEEIHSRKKSLSAIERSKISNSRLSNFSTKSPLRSPSFVSHINQQANRSPMTQSPTISLNNSFGGALKSPSSLSQNSDELSCASQSRNLLIAKQIPNIVSDPNQLLNISDMKDDINILTRSLNSPYETEKKDEHRRLSNCSVQTTKSLPSTSLEPQGNSTSITTTTNDDGTIYNSEVKSDTEEYFEYFEIDGKKYRRKMKKRTVIEKIKIQKTVYAPLKPDGSGPDLGKFEEDEQEMLADDTSALKLIDSCDSSEKILNPDPPIFRRSTEDRFRVSKSMFLPYKNNVKKLTMGYGGNVHDQISKTPALLSNYMYRFGPSEFEEPIIDKRLSSQLIDDVNSSWMKTSEFDLPHEKSKSICYFKNFRQKNEEGNTVHSAYRITASRTVRMKPQDNVTESPITFNPFNNTPILAINGEENFGDDEVSEGEVDVEPSENSQHDSFNQSTDDEKEMNSVSSQDCNYDDKEETLSTTSTMDDSEIDELIVDDTSEVLPETLTRSPSPDSCIYSSGHSSYLSEQHSFILTKNNPTPYLIFDDDAKPGECDIAGGPVDALIVHACDGKEHLLFLGAFLDTYRTFIEPEDLINRLIIRYKFFKSNNLTDIESKIPRVDSGCVENTDYVRLRNKTDQYEDPEKKCIHVLSLLLTIIGKLKKDLNDRIHIQIQIFEKYLLEINEIPWIEAFKNAIKTQKLSMEKDTEMLQLLNKLSTPTQSHIMVKSPSKESNSPTKGGFGFSSNKLTILDFESREIAEQMTLLDWSKYRDVELIEVLNLKDIANCKLPGVIEYAKHFQNVRCWTQSILLDPDKRSTSERDRCCWKFLRIMKHLRHLNNFSSLIAILLAIQLLPIKKLFSKKIRTKIMDMDDYMKPTRFIGYKQDLKEATAPCIPFLGLFYQDIVMLNIANPPYLDLDEVNRISRSSNWSTNNSQYLSLITEQCGPIINFWRSFKQYLFLKNCNKDQDKIRYSIKPNEKTLQFLNNFQDSFDEASIHRFIKQV